MSQGQNQYRTYFVVLILLVCAYIAGRYYRDYKRDSFARNHKYDSFAKCLTSKNVKMYGLYWCPHCADQKAMFGAAFRNVPYVECAIKDQPGVLAPVCAAAGAKLFPSWQFGNNPPKEGVLSLRELSDKSGCSLP